MGQTSLTCPVCGERPERIDTTQHFGGAATKQAWCRNGHTWEHPPVRPQPGGSP